MKGTLGMPTYRRVVGAGFVVYFFLLGVVLVSAPTLIPNGISGVDTYDAGVFFVFGGVVCTPCILYPCVFDTFPEWMQTKFPRFEEALRDMLCPRTKP